MLLGSYCVPNFTQANTHKVPAPCHVANFSSLRSSRLLLLFTFKVLSASVLPVSRLERPRTTASLVRQNQVNSVDHEHPRVKRGWRCPIPAQLCCHSSATQEQLRGMLADHRLRGPGQARRGYLRVSARIFLSPIMFFSILTLPSVRSIAHDRRRLVPWLP
jgi:hypothetical protein